MQPIRLKNIKPIEEIGYRINKSYSRLEDVFYRPASLFGAYNHEWPGDWEGRTLLALVLMEDITGRKPAYYDAIMEAIEADKNELGYMKGILPQGEVSEQQLSGHNWLLRALLERFVRKQDEKAEEMAKTIVRKLYLPLKEKYAVYPTNAEERSFEGGAAGHQEGKPVNGWHLSTDIGCAYMSLDALGQYYGLFGDENVAQLLDAMIDSLKRIDLKGSSMQTHATLSATRGILYYYESTGRQELLELAKDLFSYYKKYGMTENYANYNWFGRPFWTEPCAIIDSFLVAIRLFQFTQDWSYANTANRIFYNALLSAQRSNGGFGCDTCAGAEENGTVMTVKEGLYEAFFCCSMRGAEGLTASVSYSILEGENTVSFTNYLNGCYEGAQASYRVSGRYPYDGDVQIGIAQNRGKLCVRLFIPDHTSNHRVTWNGETIPFEQKDNHLVVQVVGSGVLSLKFENEVAWEPCVCDQTPAGYESCWHGILQYGKLLQEEELPLGFTQLAIEGGLYIPLSDRMYYPKALQDGIEIIRKKEEP